MAPRSFSTDGAQGAWGGGGASSGGAIPGVTMNDPGEMNDHGEMNDPGETPGQSSMTMPTGTGGSQTFFRNAPTFHNNADYQKWAGDNGVPNTGNPFDRSSQAGWSNGGTQSYSSGMGMSFAAGGAVPDGGDGENNHDDIIGLSLATVDSALQYGRKKYGLGGDNQAKGAGQQMAMNTTGFRQSDNIEDRRGDTSPPTAGSNYRTNFDNVVDKVKDFGAGYNSMSQAAGINDISSSPAKGAIPDDQEEAQ